MAAHAFGRKILESVWTRVLGTLPTTAELQMVGAISVGEGVYGRGTYRLLSIPDGAVLATVSDSNNWGAVQCGKPPCRDGCFMATDRSPRLITKVNPKGYYNVCFKRHPTPEKGAEDYLNTLMVKRPTVREAVRTGSIPATALAMYRTTYYEGEGKTEGERIAGYAAKILTNARAIAGELGEPLRVHLGSPSGGSPPPGSGDPSGGAPGGAERSWGWLAGAVGFLGLLAALKGGRR
jgi:hypothetical protein